MSEILIVLQKVVSDYLAALGALRCFAAFILTSSPKGFRFIRHTTLVIASVSHLREAVILERDCRVSKYQTLKKVAQPVLI